MTFNEHLIAGLSAAWDCSADEVQKRVATKRKRTTHCQPEDIAWTAARCQRLLRTITSRICILQKQHKLGDSDPQDGAVTSKTRVSSNAGKTTALRADDPDWLPDVEPKNSKQTYGRRSKRAARTGQCDVKTTKEQSSFSTPFVKKLLDPTSTGRPTVKRPQLITQHSSLADSKPNRQLPIQCSSSNEEAQRNLVRAFSSLLATTASSTRPSRTGAQSLLSSCLRKIPDYIDLEAQGIEEDSTGSDDVTSSLYAELESLGTRSNGGWPGLREVVRRHAFHYVCGAIRDGLIPGSRVLELVNACNREGTVLESQRLLERWSCLAQTRRHGSSRIDGAAISRLADLRETHGANELYFRTWETMLKRGQLSVGEVLRTDSPFLNALVKALIRGPGDLAAGMCLETIVVSSYELEPHAEDVALSRALDKLAGLLASVAIARNSKSDDPPVDTLAALTRRISVRLQQCGLSDPETAARDTDTHKTHPFHHASLLLDLAHKPLDNAAVAPDLRPLVSNMTALSATSHKRRDEFVHFVYTSAIHVSRFADLGHVEAFKLVTRGLRSDTTSIQRSLSYDSEVLKRLGFETAIAFAERTGTPVDEELTRGSAFHRSIGGTHRVQEGGLASPVSGFKWEDGLCEWIAATPAVRKSEKRKDAVDDIDGTRREPLSSHPSEQDAPSPGPRPVQTPLKVQPSRPTSGASPDILALSSFKAFRTPLAKRQANAAPRPRMAMSSSHEFPSPPASSEPRAAKAVRARSLKRSTSWVSLGKENALPRTRVWEDEQDELGIATPASKRRKPLVLASRCKESGPADFHTEARGLDRRPQRFSLPASLPKPGDVSEDELGL